MIILSWISPMVYSKEGAGTNAAATGIPFTANPTIITVDEGPSPSPQATHISMINPLEALFRSHAQSSGGQAGGNSMTRHERTTTVERSHFIRRLFASSPADVALFVDNKTSHHIVGSKVQIIVPFFGGPDDRLALEFVVQLCAREEVSATVIRVTKEVQQSDGDSTEGNPDLSEKAHVAEHGGGEGNVNNTIHSVARYPDTIYPNITTQTRMASDTADNICWYKYAPQDSADGTPPQHSPQIQSALKRVTFESMSSPTPLKSLISQVNLDSTGKRVLVVVGRGKRLAVESHQDEMKSFLEGDHHHGSFASGLGNEMRKTLGDVATTFVVSGVSAGLLVMQASSSSSSDGTV